MSALPSCMPIPAAATWVLAGGRSTRMGRDKALLPFGGRPLIEVAVEKLEKLRELGLGQPRIAGSRPDLSGFAAVVDDVHPGCGPLSGIEAALTATCEPLNLFLPIDMPLVPAAFLSWILLRAEVTGAIATLPRAGGAVQPLCAVYHRDLLTQVTRSLLAGDYKVTRVLELAFGEDAGMQRVDAFDIELLVTTYPALAGESVIPAHRWFENCNSPQDLEAVEAFARARK
ncbi:MAG TPA: molybdenum cofactor guanylyltransferase [Acidobacteriaceae bacterium]